MKKRRSQTQRHRVSGAHLRVTLPWPPLVSFYLKFGREILEIAKAGLGLIQLIFTKRSETVNFATPPDNSALSCGICPPTRYPYGVSATVPGLSVGKRGYLADCHLDRFNAK